MVRPHYHSLHRCRRSFLVYSVLMEAVLATVALLSLLVLALVMLSRTWSGRRGSENTGPHMGRTSGRTSPSKDHRCLRTTTRAGTGATARPNPEGAALSGGVSRVTCPTRTRPRGPLTARRRELSAQHQAESNGETPQPTVPKALAPTTVVADRSPLPASRQTARRPWRSTCGTGHGRPRRGHAPPRRQGRRLSGSTPWAGVAFETQA